MFTRNTDLSFFFINDSIAKKFEIIKKLVGHANNLKKHNNNNNNNNSNNNNNNNNKCFGSVSMFLM